MKTITTKWAMLIALMTAVSCSETETGIEPEPGGGDGQVALGINPNLKVEAGMKSTTKAVEVAVRLPIRIIARLPVWE